MVDLILGKAGIVFVTGAGVSVASGLPAFRTEDGLFSRGMKDMFYHARNPDEQQQRSKKLGELAKSMMNATPSPFHHMMALLSEQGRLHRLYSQNIDELETRFKFLEADPYEKAGYHKVENQFVRTIQLHGGMRTTRCSKSNHIQELVPQDLINGFQETLQCARCEMKQQEDLRTKRHPRNTQLGINEANIVLYSKNPDDSKPERDMAFVDKDARNTAVGLVIVCGTSATLPVTKQLIANLANREGHKRDSLWINTEDPPCLSGFEFIHCFRGDCQEIAWELLRRYKEKWGKGFS